MCIFEALQMLKHLYVHIREVVSLILEVFPTREGLIHILQIPIFPIAFNSSKFRVRQVCAKLMSRNCVLSFQNIVIPPLFSTSRSRSGELWGVGAFFLSWLPPDLSLQTPVEDRVYPPFCPNCCVCVREKEGEREYVCVCACVCVCTKTLILYMYTHV